MGVTNKTDRTIDSVGSTAGYVQWFANHTTNLRSPFSRRQVLLLLLLLLFLSGIHPASHGHGLVRSDQAPPHTVALQVADHSLFLLSHDFFRAFPRKNDAQNWLQGSVFIERGTGNCSGRSVTKDWPRRCHFSPCTFSPKTAQNRSHNRPNCSPGSSHTATNSPRPLSHCLVQPRSHLDSSSHTDHRDGSVTAQTRPHWSGPEHSAKLR